MFSQRKTHLVKINKAENCPFLQSEPYCFLPQPASQPQPLQCMEALLSFDALTMSVRDLKLMASP